MMECRNDEKGYFQKMLGIDRKPDFDQLLRVFERKTPIRPTPFEYFLNERLYNRLTGIMPAIGESQVEQSIRLMKAYAKAGYDYVALPSSGLDFPTGSHGDGHAKTYSLNDGACISDRKTFLEYPWPDPELLGTPVLDAVGAALPEGMKIILFSPGGGCLEIVISIVGYEELCFMVSDNPRLVDEIFEAVGSRLCRYFEMAVSHPAVGACLVSDDWGFKTQTMLSVKDMRRYVFGWTKKATRIVHEAGKPALLHSCGELKEVMEDIIGDMGFDAKHSFEDTIMTVEDAYNCYGRRIGILGGIDVDFLCRSTPDEIFTRARHLIDRTGCTGYALGSGNSIPNYVPDENWAAMAWAAFAD